MHRIAVLALHGVIPFDLATPCGVFENVRLRDRQRAYDVSVCGETKDIKAGLFDIRTRWGLSDIADAHTLIVPGVANVAMPLSDEVLSAIRNAASSGKRIASICTGAFVLAAAGVLDGWRATTHWLAAAELARRYPAITVDPNVLFIDNGQLLTSAGACAGMDLCLHIVRKDHGAVVAANSARAAVMPLHREGGQAQFISYETPPTAKTLQPLLTWMDKQLHKPLALVDIARQATMSTRTLNRRFFEQTGATPLQWLLAARVRRAQQLLETTNLSVEQVAARTGFGSAATLRDRFAKITGTSPLNYRSTFGLRKAR